MNHSHLYYRLIFICAFLIIIISNSNEFYIKESLTNSIFVRNNCIDNYFDKIVCIVMPNRKPHMQDTFRQWGIRKVEFFNAIDKSNYTHQNFIDQKILSQNYNPYLNLGRICCHLSALTVYKNFLYSNATNILIFEDDLYKNEYKNISEFNNKIQPYLENIPHDWEYLNFGKCSDFCNLSITKNNYWTIPARPLCRTAIALTKKAAKSIIKHTSFMHKKPGDVMISDLIKNKMFIAYSSNAQLFKQDRQNFGSNLENYNITHLKMCRD